MNQYLSTTKVAYASAILLVSSLTQSTVATPAPNKLQPQKQNQELIDIGYNSFLLTKSDIVYSYDEMLNFDIHNYLEEKAPHLLKYAEIISHYSGYHAVSPKVIISLMDSETGLLQPSKKKSLTAMIVKSKNEKMRKSHSSPLVINKPFGSLSTKNSFKDQVDDVASQLSVAVHGEKSLRELLSNDRLEKLSENFEELFPIAAFKINNTPENEKRMTSRQAMNKVPSSTYFQLPYPVGNSWYVGGTHANDGGTGVHSSLDMSYYSGWGNSNIDSLWVAASAPGTLKIHSSCFAEIIHASGWSTTYYHIGNIRYNTNTYLNRNSGFANYAKNKNQALCKGGSSTGPHLHFSMKYNGYFNNLHNVYLSGWRVDAGRWSYDTDCNNAYVMRSNGTYRCPGQQVYNYGL